MARSDSFFIRASVNTNGTTFAQTSVDLGAYVDALGKSVLRIHNIEVAYGDGTDAYSLGVGLTQATAFQVTTQSQGAIVNMTDKSLIASGRLMISNSGANPGVSSINEQVNVGPHSWNNGYLVGVEQIYLATDSSTAGPEVDSVQIVLECTVETLSQSAAMALALSQQ